MPEQKTISRNKSWQANWQREIEGAYLYRRLADLARTPAMKKTLAEMADQEEVHAAMWAERIQGENPDNRPPNPDLRIRMTVWLARWFGPEAVLGLLINDEASDITTYANQAQRFEGETETYQRVLSDEATHARALARLRNPESTGPSTEPWHRGAKAGGWLRDIVYGFNDGLTANFGLVTGVLGASVSDKTVLLAGFAGLLADALSMAASGYLAARSEQQVREHHLALERAELRFMPEEERQELAHYFEQKGLPAEEAASAADRLMKDPQAALTELAREELGIDPNAQESPLQEGIVTGIATGLGAVIPILPFLFLSGAVAVWTAIIISMIGHFVVGAGRAVFTGRPALRSGFDMFVVGMGVALVTYVLGQIFGVNL
jgi:VIT1/CCC1 family predicted Fe2+/Mn2+ transporter/rubrerythrin